MCEGKAGSFSSKCLIGGTTSCKTRGSLSECDVVSWALVRVTLHNTLGNQHALVAMHTHIMWTPSCVV